MTVRGIMDALGNQLQAKLVPLIPDLQVVSRMTWNPTPPTIDIYPAPEFQAGLGFGRDDSEVNFTVRARVNTPDHEGAQDLLLAMMDPRNDTSVAAAITAAGTAAPAKTLDGTVQNVTVDGPTDFGVFIDPGPNAGALMGCTWNVKVFP